MDLTTVVPSLSQTGSLLSDVLQYYKIDLSFRIKLQEINLYVCGEYIIIIT